MNPSIEAFVDPPDGFHEKPGTRSNREGQFSPPEARVVVEPRMQLLGLCSFDARRKSRFLVLGAKKRRFFGAPKYIKSRQKIFLGGRKSYLAAEHHNEAAPKKKKKPRFFRLGAEKYCSLGARRKSRFLVLGAEKTKKPPKKNNWEAKKNWGGRNFLGRGRKSYLAAEHHNETASKKKKKKIRMGSEKYDFRPPKEQRPIATLFEAFVNPSDEFHRFSGTASNR